MTVSSLLHVNSPFRIFAISGLITIGAVVAVWAGLGPGAAFLTMVLIVIEVMFSFDNAIINARVLRTLSKFWQTMFLTIGILIAVFGMRIVFPIAIVALTASLDWQSVINLALNKPEEYAAALDAAHVSIAAFGGMFLLTLFLQFFFDPAKEAAWIETIEKPATRVTKGWWFAPIALAALLIASFVPFNTHQLETFVAGLIGLVSYVVIHSASEYFGKVQEARGVALRTGVAGLIGFLYLEVLDASFSLDGVIGAFAVTNNVVLIAAGLGVGAVWVRSLTVFMVRRQTLQAYKYLDHGAHYTIGILALMLLISLFINVPEAVAGLLGLVVIGLSIYESIVEKRRDIKKA